MTIEVGTGVTVAHGYAPPAQKEYSGVSEPQRLALHRAAQEALGEEEGDTLMVLSPPANTDTATRQDVEHATALISAQLRARTWRVVVGTGVVLYLALIGTTFAGVSLLLNVLDLA